MAAASSGGVAGEEGVAGEGHPGVHNLGGRDKDYDGVQHKDVN